MRTKYMEIKTFFFVLLAFYSIGIFGQSPYVESEPYFRDNKIAKQYRDSLSSKLIDTFTIYLSMEDEHEVSYFLWWEKSRIKVVKVTDTTISEVLCLSNFSFATHLVPSEVALRKKEDQLKFVPPFDLNEVEVIVFYLSGKSFIVAQGNVDNYVLQKQKREKRSKLFMSLKSDLSKVKDKFQKKQHYERPM
jgi:hypothetical protein